MQPSVKIEADCNIKAVTGRQGGKEGWDLIAIPGGMPGAERIRDSVRLTPRSSTGGPCAPAMICATPATSSPRASSRASPRRPSRVHRRDRRSLEETQPYTEGRVVWDANIITSRGPGTPGGELCCVEAIFGRAKAGVAGPMVTQPHRAFEAAFEWRLEEEVPSRVDRGSQERAT